MGGIAVSALTGDDCVVWLAGCVSGVGGRGYDVQPPLQTERQVEAILPGARTPGSGELPIVFVDRGCETLIVMVMAVMVVMAAAGGGGLQIFHLHIIHFGHSGARYWPFL